MGLLRFILFSSLFLFPVLGQDPNLQEALTNNGFTEFLSTLDTAMAQDQTFASEMTSPRNDLTLYVPSNSAMEAAKRRRRQSDPVDQAKSMITYPQPQNNPPPIKRRGSKGSTPSNYEVSISLLADPKYANIRISDCDYPQVRWVKNLASGPCPATEVTTGLGKTTKTVKGPIKFDKGLIYEVDSLFHLPETFNTTFKELKIAEEFYDIIVKSHLLDYFEDTPALTIFAPIDCKGCGDHKPNPEAHVIPGLLGYTPNLIPYTTYKAKSGYPISVKYGTIGGKSVNGRNFVLPNVITRNGIVHFIDGPLDCPPSGGKGH